MKRKIYVVNYNGELESLESYCLRLSKKNNSVLYKLENYLNKKMLEDVSLIEIRDLILTVSADIARLSERIVVNGEEQ